MNVAPLTRLQKMSTTATASAVALITRVQDEAGRTEVRAVPTKYAVTTAATTFPSAPPFMMVSIDALIPMMSIA